MALIGVLHVNEDKPLPPKTNEEVTHKQRVQKRI